MKRHFLSVGDAGSGSSKPVRRVQYSGRGGQPTKGVWLTADLPSAAEDRRRELRWDGRLGMRLSACLLRALLFLCLVPGASAAPRLWIEARLDPPAVPVNVQATLIVRFGHAVDVRSPRLDAPPVRLAELVPLGSVASSETTRDGVRYRVLERRFAVLPFASGDLPLSATVSGTTPAALPEIGGRSSFTLAAPALRLPVSPAPTSAGWLPAHELQFSADNATPSALRVGEVWTRQLLIEAVGVDGSVIPPPRWPATPGWSLQFDPPEVGRRIEGGRVIGYRRQLVHAQALQSGRLDFPVPRLRWWQVATGQWRESAPAAASLDVVASPPLTSAAARPNGDFPAAPVKTRGLSGNLGGTTLVLLSAVLALSAAVIFSGRGRDTRRALQLTWRRRQLWSALVAACRANDAPATRRALLAWAAACGLPARSPEVLADGLGTRCGSLADALAGLEAACYGRPGDGWNAQALQRALPALARCRRGNSGAGMAGWRIGSARGR